jgi:hypothetical protein
MRASSQGSQRQTKVHRRKSQGADDDLARDSRELLPKSKVLEGERATRREDRAEAPDQKAQDKAHGSAILPRPRMLTIPRAHEVFADHDSKSSCTVTTSCVS